MVSNKFSSTKEYLSQINRLDRMIENKLSEIYQLKTMACSVTISNQEERVKTSLEKHRLDSTVSKIVDLEKETNKLVENFSNKRNHIIEQIDKMEDVDCYHILSMRYVGKNTFEDIAQKTNWSIRKVFSIHGKALQEFEKKYGEEYLENVQ